MPYSIPNQGSKFSSHGGWEMKDRELEKMPLDDLWSLHERIASILDRKLQRETHKLQSQLDELGRKFGGSPSDIPQRRPYPKVEPKFRNPADPSITWSGRGKQPRWLVAAIKTGRKMEDFEIGAVAESKGRRQRT
jgi:DNA-binding protein H-NS